MSDLLQGGQIGARPILGQAFGPGEAHAPGDLLTEATVDEPVAIIEQPLPRYPEALRRAGIPGRVELSYVVDTLGRVEPTSLRALSTTHPAFEAAARGSVLAGRFQPARLRGVAVRQLVRQTISFRWER